MAAVDLPTPAGPNMNSLRRFWIASGFLARSGMKISSFCPAWLLLRVRRRPPGEGSRHNARLGQNRRARLGMRRLGSLVDREFRDESSEPNDVVDVLDVVGVPAHARVVVRVRGGLPVNLVQQPLKVPGSPLAFGLFL